MVFANSSVHFVTQAKSRLWVENILGRELEAGEQVGIQDLAGGKAPPDDRGPKAR
jgi:hypothetical protein